MEQVRSDMQWHSLVLWRGLAVFAKKYLKKGSLILLEGRIRYRSYEDKEGTRKYVTEIIGDQLILPDRPVPESRLRHDPDSADETLPF